MGITAALGKLVAGGDGKIGLIRLVGKKREDEQSVLAQGRGGGLEQRRKVSEMDQGRRAQDRVIVIMVRGQERENVGLLQPVIDGFGLRLFQHGG